MVQNNRLGKHLAFYLSIYRSILELFHHLIDDYNPSLLNLQICTYKFDASLCLLKYQEMQKDPKFEKVIYLVFFRLG